MLVLGLGVVGCQLVIKIRLRVRVSVRLCFWCPEVQRPLQGVSVGVNVRVNVSIRI